MKNHCSRLSIIVTVFEKKKRNKTLRRNKNFNKINPIWFTLFKEVFTNTVICTFRTDPTKFSDLCCIFVFKEGRDLDIKSETD